MKTLRNIIFFVVAFSAAAFTQGQYMTYYTWMYIDKTNGQSQGGAVTEFQDPNGYNPYDSVDASVSMNVHDNYGWWATDFEFDNGGMGYASASYSLPGVRLNDTYTITGQHEVSGDMDEPCGQVYGFNNTDCSYYSQGVVQYIQETEYSSGSLSVPPPPSIQACTVETPEAVGGNLQRNVGEGEIYYCVNPPILYSAVVVVGPDVGTTNNSNYGPFPFRAYDMPYGTSFFQFIGSMYGVEVGDSVPNSASVTRTRLSITSDSWARWTGNIVCDENTHQNQNFYLETVESPNDWFSYVIPSSNSSAVDDLSFGGTANVYVDPAVEGCSLQVGQPPLLGVSGSNSLVDSIGGWYQGMSYPTGPTLPPQTEYFQSANNSWSLFFQPVANGQICASFFITSDDILVGTRAINECLNNPL